MVKYHDAYPKASPAWAGLVNVIFQQLDKKLTDMDDGTHAFSAIDVDGGAIDGTTIGGTTPGAGTFTTIAATGDLNLGSCFRTRINFLQTVLTLETDLVLFDEIALDNNDDFDITTHRFQPSVAGWYFFVAQIQANAGTTKEVIVQVRKNGTTASAHQRVSLGTHAEALPHVAIQQANGSTDYFDVYFYNGNSTTTTIQGEFMGFRIR